MSDADYLIDPNAVMEPETHDDTSHFTTDDHTELNHLHYGTPDGKTLIGTWECAPTKEVIEAYAVDELMHIVFGKITLTHKDGRVEHLGAGDTFFIAKGQYVVWEITERLRKLYMIVG